MLFDLTDQTLSPVQTTSFIKEHVLERTHLQAAIRDRVSVIGDDLLVVAEEFGDFEGAHRRIDLLAVDRTGRLVVIELKRTDEGGHMELQAIRYAAMVSAMTFEELVDVFARFLKATGRPDHSPDDARARLIDWMDDTEGDVPVISRDVRIVLVSRDFSTEITTTVLWLNEFSGLDIRCVRLTPYKFNDHLLLDVQQLIPLPEAEELMIRLKKREAAAKQAKAESTKDFTKYVIKVAGETTEPLPKRWAMLELVRALHTHGVPCSDIATVLPGAKFKAVAGAPETRLLWDSICATHGLSQGQDKRWHLDHPLREPDKTWVLSNQWGVRAPEWMAQLLAMAPPGIEVETETGEKIVPAINLTASS